MRKKVLLTIWLLIPIALLAYHYGPGQQGVAADKVATHVQAAEEAEKTDDWSGALEAYDLALKALPAEDVALRNRLRLKRANARMYNGELPEAMGDMENLLDELLKVNADPVQVRETRSSLAAAQYYAAWLMRLEGATADEWTVEAESSRQHFRLLAEESLQAKDQDAAIGYQKNLESTIRLARMDLSELQGLPLPKQCKGCKNCSQKCRKQRESRAKKPSDGEKKKPQDARKAGAGKRPEGTGS